MGARYVWDKYEVDRSFVESEISNSYYRYPGTWSVQSGQIVGYSGIRPNLVYDSDGKISGADLESPKTVTATTQGQPVNSYGQFFAWKKKENVTEYIKSLSQYGYWKVNSGGSYPTIYVDQQESGAGVPSTIRKYTLTDSMGVMLGLVSSPNNNAYPTTSGGEESGGYWYTYKGSDGIDPTAITYPTQDLEAGQKITISITPSSSKTYGGTVTYQYQYKQNGGNWENLISTTALSASYTIPEATTSIQFRVLASDNLGFVSTTYVTGQSAAVSQLKAYIGINGKARKVEKIYIGVNGKARQVVKGYVGVNGKARKFL